MSTPPPLAARASLALACLALGATLGPRVLVGRDADGFFDDDERTQTALADAVAEYVSGEVGAAAFHTGSARFDGEWAMGTHPMAALGLAQVVRAHPELAPRYLPALELSVEQLLRDDTYVFAREAWGSGPFERLENGEGHAYLGYVALALGSLREVDPATPHAALHDRLVEELARRLEESPRGIVETYPGEAYPCDIASIVGAIGQHDRLTGTDHRALIARMGALYRSAWVDPRSGYLAQALDPRTGEPRDAPRGSGTALGAYFWSFADPSVASSLDQALLGRGRESVLGFDAIREYGPGDEGSGDIDSGPVVLGVSVSATGFALSAARRTGDREAFRGLFRTAALFGVPVAHGESTRFLSGGPLGNAILLAMLTARPS